jgi:hypothetical protein
VAGILAGVCFGHRAAREHGAVGTGAQIRAEESLGVEALRARVEAIGVAPRENVLGETIAATTLLPTFYESRNFRPA